MPSLLKPTPARASLPNSVKVLGEPIEFRNGRQAKNRIMKAPLTEKLYLWTSDPSTRGAPSLAIGNLYSKWAHGGYGMIVTGSIATDPKYVLEAGQAVISKETCQQGWKELADALKAENSLAIGQLSHPGGRAIPKYTSSKGNVFTLNGEVENPLKWSKKRVEQDLIARFVYAAITLCKHGFDGVELMSAFGNAMSMFMSSENDRKDEYGGANKTNLLVKTFQEIRKVVPKRFLIGVKLNSSDFQKMAKVDVVKVLQIVEKTGFDYIQLTGGFMEMSLKNVTMRDTTAAREDYFAEFLQLSRQIFKSTVTYITGGWSTVDSMISSVIMDLTQGIGMARASCALPDFPNKLLAGKITSLPDQKFPPFDFWYFKNAALWNMKKMAETEYDESFGVSHNLSDFTNEKEAANFKKACDKYKTLVEASGGVDQHPGALDYDPVGTKCCHKIYRKLRARCEKA